ncbi:hypothetical protein DSM3645_07051 [Blastopirellula marina DSM 3645]|uniref:Uncharacterized protein n=1 Tax=Blastopirellula marina DSM 3645 TaxID=314230 RepID=A3ZYH9_9BACT|nr:hypothetical protein DSM3645_07051 [Blastopirellula marina DSM 3645]
MVTAVFSCAADQVKGQDSLPQQVFKAQQSLGQWLGEGKKRQGWDDYLLSDTLLTQIQLGDKASPEVLEKVLHQYQSDAPGLKLPQFVLVRTKLASWIQAIDAEKKPVAEIFVDAQGKFRPVTPEQAAAAKAKLEAAIGVLEKYIHDSGSATEQGWKSYLRWDDLTQQLAAESPDLGMLERCYLRFHSGAKGLEYQQFADVRRALRRYIDLQFFASTEQYQAMYEMQLGLLVENLKKYADDPNADDAAAVGAQLGWFAQGGQIPELVQSARDSLNYPNLFLTASERFVGYGIDRKVDDTKPVRDNILGTSIYGTGRTVGDLKINLIPNAAAAQVQLVLDAVTRTNNVGRNGQVTVHSSGVTSVLGKKSLLVDAEGVSDTRATAECRTSSTFNSIQANSGLVRNIATNKAYQQKSQAEAIASQHAEQRVVSRMEAETVKLIQDANTRLRKEVRQPLDSRDEFLEIFEISSTSDAIHVMAMKANRFQLAAPTLPPAPAPSSADIGVQLHESMPTNMGEVLLGGIKLTDVKLVELLKERGTEVPEELKITPEKDPWSITFDYKRPVEVRFGQDRIEISIRGRQFTRGDSEFNNPARISAVYLVERGEKGAKLTREGEVSVEYLSRERQGIRDITLKTFLHKKFEALFEPEIVGEGLKLKGRWAGAGPLQLEDLVISDGWATLGWVMPVKKTANKDLASGANSVK